MFLLRSTMKCSVWILTQQHMLLTWNQEQSQQYSPCRPFILMLKLKLFKKFRNFSQLGSSSLSCTQDGFQTLYQSRRRMDKYDAVLTFGTLIKHASRMNFHFRIWICSLIQLLCMLCFHSWMVSAVIIRSECHPKMQPKWLFKLLLVTFTTLSCPLVSKMPEPYIKGL